MDRITDRERAAIVAALDVLWCYAFDGYVEPNVDASNGGTLTPLSHDEIHTLRNRIAAEMGDV